MRQFNVVHAWAENVRTYLLEDNRPLWKAMSLTKDPSHLEVLTRHSLAFHETVPGFKSFCIQFGFKDIEKAKRDLREEGKRDHGDVPSYPLTFLSSKRIARDDLALQASIVKAVWQGIDPHVLVEFAIRLARYSYKENVHFCYGHGDEATLRRVMGHEGYRTFLEDCYTDSMQYGFLLQHFDEGHIRVDFSDTGSDVWFFPTPYV